MPLSIAKSVASHTCNITTVIHHCGKVICCYEDGMVKVFSTDLISLIEKQLHESCIMSIAATGSSLYTCCNDSSIQHWNLNTLENNARVNSSLYEPQKLLIDESGSLWGCDNKGCVAKYDNNEEAYRLELVEEIWDFYVTVNPPYIYTARDRDNVLFELVSGKRTRVHLKATWEGRSPVCIVGHYLCFLSRDGRNISVYENNSENKFPKVRDIVASELIINALCRVSDSVICSGGYDNSVQIFDVTSGQQLGEVKLETCVNSLCSDDNNIIFAACGGGLVKLVID